MADEKKTWWVSQGGRMREAGLYVADDAEAAIDAARGGRPAAEFSAQVAHGITVLETEGALVTSFDKEPVRVH